LHDTYLYLEGSSGHLAGSPYTGLVHHPSAGYCAEPGVPLELLRSVAESGVCTTTIIIKIKIKILTIIIVIIIVIPTVIIIIIMITIIMMMALERFPAHDELGTCWTILGSPQQPVMSNPIRPTNTSAPSGLQT